MAMKDLFELIFRKGVARDAVDMIRDNEPVKSSISAIGDREAPGQPKQPNTNEDQLWAYPSWWNSTGSGIGGVSQQNVFLELRRYAKLNPVIQYCIQQRQLQIAKLQFKVMYKDGKRKADKKCQRVEDLLSHPNNSQIDFYQFIMAFIYDLLVLDAVAVKPYFDANGDVKKIELIDPAYISIKVDSRGQIPDAPQVAYQFENTSANIIKDYSTEDLLYIKMNAQSDTPYGTSLVEKSLKTIMSLAKRREYQDAYYTEGNMPENIMSVHEKMSPKQLLEFQHYFNTFFSGKNLTAKKHKLKLIPHDWKLIQAKQPEIKSDMDDSLKREICAIFNVPAGALVSDTNKATAESNRKQAAANGSDAYITFIEKMITLLINLYIGYPDMKFSFIQEDSIDPLQQNQSLQLATGGAPFMRVNEAREKSGLGPDDELQAMQIERAKGVSATGENRNVGQKDVKNDAKTAEPELPNPNEDR